MSRLLCNGHSMILSMRDICRLNGLTIGHINVCSLRNKVDEIHILLLDSKLDILGISETNLDCNIPDSSLHIDGYTFIRQDRQDHSIRASGGGVGIYIREGLVFEKLDDFCMNDANLEMQCVKLKLK